MKRPRVTSRDVAARAGVSRGAVSLILNESTAITFSDETRRRVFQAAEELNYRPNSVGRMLVRGDTETIGLVVRDLSLLHIDPFLPQLLYGIVGKTRERGYHVLLEFAHLGSGPNAYGSLVTANRIDGLIVENPPKDDHGLGKLIEEGFPVVLVGTVNDEREYSVSVDNVGGARSLVEYLMQDGRRRIAHISYSCPGVAGTDDRLTGYRLALERFGLEYDPSLVAWGNFSSESGYKAMQALLAGSDRRPDALLAGSDTVAMGAMAAIMDAGLRIPDDVAVASFDNIPAAASFRPALTTLDMFPILHGEIAAEMLMARLNGDDVPARRRIVETEMILRQSTRIPPPAAAGNRQG